MQEGFTLPSYVSSDCILPGSRLNQGRLEIEYRPCDWD